MESLRDLELLYESFLEKENKKHNEIAEFVLKSIAAGMLIGFGCVVNMLCENHVVGSFMFSLGLLSVIIFQCNLFTGKVGYAEYSGAHVITYLLPMLILNLIGIWTLCYVFSNMSGIIFNVNDLIEDKYSEGPISALIRSFGCGCMMYIAVEGYRRMKNPLIVVMAVMCFILCGFDHCIANYGYMALGEEYYCYQLPLWIIGNSAGSLVLAELLGKEKTK